MYARNEFLYNEFIFSTKDLPYLKSQRNQLLYSPNVH